MTVKLLVLYPHPADKDEFEQKYVGKHLPLMRALVGPDVPLPTYRTLARGGRPAAYYRVAEIHFDDMEHLEAFARSEKARIGRESAIEVSSGGAPILLVCQPQSEI